MKTFLFIILTFLVNHTNQYENAEESMLLHTENSPDEHEENSHDLRRGDIKDYDTGDLQPYSEHYQNYYRELKDTEKVRPLRGLRSASEIKNWVKDMIAMRGRGMRPHPPHHPPPPNYTNKPIPSKPTRKPIHSGEFRGISFENKDNTEEEQILLDYTPKYKTVDVPMIIFVPE